MPVYERNIALSVEARDDKSAEQTAEALFETMESACANHVANREVLNLPCSDASVELLEGVEVV